MKKAQEGDRPALTRLNETDGVEKSTITSKVNRNPVFDVMKGIGILLVIVGHSSAISYHPLRHLIFTFHMPLFFIVSGYFFSQKSGVKLLKDDFRRLVNPYIVTSVFFLLWFVIRRVVGLNNEFPLSRYLLAVVYGSGSNHHSMLLGTVPFVGAIWFLLALFWCRFFFNALYKDGKYSYLLIGGISVAATLTDFYLINLPFDVLTGMSAMMFYAVGHIVRHNKEMICRNNIPLLLLGAVCWYVAFAYSHNYMVCCSYGMYPLDIVAGCFGTWCIYLLSKVVVRISVMKRVFAWLGVNSLTILCAHFFELHTGLWFELSVPDVWYFKLPLQICFAVLIVILFSYVPYLKSTYSIKRQLVH